jgi:chromosomal replication initiation ATPase DnaA
MLLLLEECWTRVQGELKERVGSATYEAWLQSLRPVLLERGTVYLEADNRLAADRVTSLFRATLVDVLSRDFGTDLQVEIQSREQEQFDALEVSPQRPVIDDGNRTPYLVLRSLLPANRVQADAVSTDGNRLEFGGDLPPSRLVPSSLYVFHGPPGVGKTFLLRWWREHLTARSMWYDLTDLHKAFQRASQEKRLDRLYEELCADRPLVIDEAHRLSHKPGLQSFVQRILEERERQRSITILSSRWHPKDVRDLNASLSSSLLAGFVAAVERPGPLGRLRYLRALEGAPSRNGRATQVEALAQQVVGSYPELRAAWAASRGQNLPPRYLELIDPSRVFARLRDRIADRFGVTAEALVGKGQGRALSRARKILALLCQQQGLSGGEIGRSLGRTRAAVSYMLLSLQQEMAKSPDLNREVEDLT